MADSLFSPVWYRVSDLHPRLRAGVRVQRQMYQGEPWYLLIDDTGGRQSRINRAAYELIGRFDGQVSVNEVWTALLQRFGDDAPTQEEVVRILARLSDAELVQFESEPDIAGMFRQRAQRRRRRRPWVNPLSFSVPLFDPARVLDRIEPVLRPILRPATLAAWGAAVLLALLAAGAHWSELRAHAGGYLATGYYLVLAWVCYPLIKGLHELAHAIAVRRRGGEVHEMGLTMLFFMPMPYVDASAANAFRDRWDRAAVSAAGIIVELGLAAVALAVWLNVGPGLIGDVAFVVMFLCVASSLLFNANPLLRFDGYYLLCDALDMPNLGVRSNAYWMYVLRRWLGGGDRVPAPAMAPRERKWLVAYAPCALLYRLTLAFALTLWIGSKSAMLGWIAAALVAAYLVVRPAWSTVRSLAESLPLGRARRRASIVATSAAAVALALVLVVPLPNTLLVQGVVWPPERAQVRAEHEGFVQRVVARDGATVEAGTPLLELTEPALEAEHVGLRSRVQALEARRYQLLLSDPSMARNTIEELGQAQVELQRVEERIAQLTVRSKVAGRLVLPHAEDLPGTFLQKGAMLGYVLSAAPTAVRAVVPGADAPLLRAAAAGVEVLLPGRGTPTPARLEREVPAAGHALPSAALGERGGGRFVTDPADKEGVRTLEPVFLFDLELPGERLERLGQRAWVRFDLGAAPLAVQGYRRLRQVLLQHFNPVL